MTVYYLEEYKQKKTRKSNIPLKKTGLKTKILKLQLKACLPIAAAGLTYIFFIVFAATLMHWSQ